MEITIDQAKSLNAIVEYGGYAKAAEKLHKSHSSLIYMIRTLEEQCDFPIFDRGAYRNTLTPLGKRVHEKCVEILTKVDELSQLCTQFNEGWEPSLRIVYDGALSFDPFIKIYRHFQDKKIPTIIQTHVNYLEDVESNFTTMNADLMLSIMPVETRGLDFVHLKKHQSYLVAHKDHLLNQTSKRWTLNDLHQFNFLTIRGSGKKLGLGTFELEESASFFFSDFHVKKEAILKGLGFGWLPQHLITIELKNRTLIPIKWERPSVHSVQPNLYFSKKKNQLPATQMIIEFFKG